MQHEDKPGAPRKGCCGVCAEWLPPAPTARNLAPGIRPSGICKIWREFPAPKKRGLGALKSQAPIRRQIRTGFGDTCPDFYPLEAVTVEVV